MRVGRLARLHHGAAALYLVAGGLGLVWVAPELADGLFPQPRVVAVTHLLTLGWVTLSLIGLVSENLPVIAGRPIRWPGLGFAAWGALVAGVFVFVAGMSLAAWKPMVWGAALVSVGVLSFCLNLAATLRRPPRRGVAWWALACSALFLVFSMALGMVLAANLRWGLLADGSVRAVGVHLHLAVAGWALLAVMGLFVGLWESPGAAPARLGWAGRVAIGLTALGAGLLSLFHHMVGTWAVLPVELLLGGGLLAFLVYVAAQLAGHRAGRPVADTVLIAASLLLFAVAMAMAPLALARGAAAGRLATAYVGALVPGGLALVVLSMRRGALAGPILRARNGSGPIAVAGVALAVAGAAGLVVAILAGAATAVRVCAVLYLAGTVMLLAGSDARTSAAAVPTAPVSPREPERHLS